MRGVRRARIGASQLGGFLRRQLSFPKFSSSRTSRGLRWAGPAALGGLLVEHDVRILRISVREPFRRGAARAAGKKKRRKNDR